MTVEAMEWTPEDLDIKDVDLTDVATTKYASPILDLSDFIDILVFFTRTQVGATTAGAVKLTIELFANDGSTLILTQDTLTAIPTAVAGTQEEHLVFGGQATVTHIGGGTLSGSAGVLRVIHKARFTIEIVTASDAATSSLGNMYIKASR